MERADTLFRSILFITIATIFLILITGFITNRILIQKLWRPFYEILKTVADFKLGSKESLHFPNSEIDEFKLMSSTIQASTNRINKDYYILKEFTENASHEMQTPLAVIRSKIDLLTQEENLTDHQSQAIQSCYNAIHRLTKLNRSLLLLTKIENRQFEEKEYINLKEKILEKAEEFKELWQNANVTTTVNLSDTSVKMNPELADILLNNLLSNATRHNYNNGFINVLLTKEFLEVSNTSKDPALSQDKIFSRFFKSTTNNNYTGLGLAIIKEISDLYQFKISYYYQENQHNFKIIFK
jgi:signal transduction histidine kinase